MGERLTVRHDSDQVDALEEMQRHGEADDWSEAIRIACNTGLQELGYLQGSQRDTRLRVLARRFGDAFAMLGIMWVGLTFWLPIGYRTLAVAPFGAWAACVALDRVLARYEPSVSNRLGLLQSPQIATDGGEKE